MPLTEKYQDYQLLKTNEAYRISLNVEYKLRSV